jgi:hypothetical protein
MSTKFITNQCAWDYISIMSFLYNIYTSSW